MQTVAIISALDEEAAHIADSLDNMTVTERASLSVARGTLTTDAGEELDVAVTVGGMGLVNAAATTQFLIDLVHPEAVIF
ncbi:5'-methylthioadenosine nucleosidase, partial [Bifidobacterium breve]|nr:5'-methylthioadenosine nucleosidase [Bifidobacterium breve]